MKRQKALKNKKNFILLTGFAAALSGALLLSSGIDRYTADSIAMAPSASLVSSASDKADDTTTGTVSDASRLGSTTVSVPSRDAAAPLSRSVYTVVEYDTPVTMYTSDTVNVRSGAGTDYDKLGKLSFGSSTLVTGETDNGWYEVNYLDTTAFIKSEYMAFELPSIPYLFVGDSRTVQMKMAVGSADKAYVAKVGEGYNYFKNTVLPEISSYAGNGTTMIINFGVNDLGNIGKYIKLVNNNIDAWSEAGINVCYAAVTPVGECNSVDNAQIEAFNARLQNELDPRVKYLDGYSYLSQNGFSTADGLHYNKDTYKSLYSYYMSVLQQ